MALPFQGWAKPVLRDPFGELLEKRQALLQQKAMQHQLDSQLPPEEERALMKREREATVKGAEAAASNARKQGEVLDYTLNTQIPVEKRRELNEQLAVLEEQLKDQQLKTSQAQAGYQNALAEEQKRKTKEQEAGGSELDQLSREAMRLEIAEKRQALMVAANEIEQNANDSALMVYNAILQNNPDNAEAALKAARQHFDQKAASIAQGFGASGEQSIDKPEFDLAEARNSKAVRDSLVKLGQEDEVAAKMAGLAAAQQADVEAGGGTATEDIYAMNHLNGERVTMQKEGDLKEVVSMTKEYQRLKDLGYTQAPNQTVQLVGEAPNLGLNKTTLESIRKESVESGTFTVQFVDASADLVEFLRSNDDAMQMGGTLEAVFASGKAHIESVAESWKGQFVKNEQLSEDEANDQMDKLKAIHNIEDAQAAAVKDGYKIKNMDGIKGLAKRIGESQLITLAFQLALAQNGARITDKDVALAMDQLGGAWRTPESMQTLLEMKAVRMHRNYVLQMDMMLPDIINNAPSVVKSIEARIEQSRRRLSSFIGVELTREGRRPKPAGAPNMPSKD